MVIAAPITLTLPNVSTRRGDCNIGRRNLLAALPYVVEKIETINQLRPFAEELQRIYRKIRRDAPAFHGTLRNLKERNNARISVFEDVPEDNDHDYVGPSGFMGGVVPSAVHEDVSGSEEQLWRSEIINRLLNWMTSIEIFLSLTLLGAETT